MNHISQWCPQKPTGRCESYRRGSIYDLWTSNRSPRECKQSGNKQAWKEFRSRPWEPLTFCSDLQMLNTPTFVYWKLAVRLALLSSPYWSMPAETFHHRRRNNWSTFIFKKRSWNFLDSFLATKPPLQQLQRRNSIANEEDTKCIDF